MDIVRLSITRPVGVAVGVILIVMFGIIGLKAIPIQLTPNIDRPIIKVTTNWPGRGPEEIVDEITKEQEERLKNVANLRSMDSTSSEGQAEITLEFYINANIERSLQEVADALRQVPEYPDEVDEPVIKASEGSSENAIAWIIIDLDPEKRDKYPNFDITTLLDPLEKKVKPHLERADGVSQVNIFGGREREVRVMLDPASLAQRGLNQLDIISALRSQNQNVSAGSISEGKRDYRIRLVGQFTDAEQVLNTVVAYREGKPVHIRELGDVEVSYKKQRGFIRSFGAPSLAVQVLRKNSANVMEAMADIRARLDEVRADILPTIDPVVGPDLRIRQLYDETTYIQSAIDLVKQNLWIGGLIAGFVLLLFLRSFTSTGVVVLAIPVSIIGTFLILLALGRSINVISLAGLAFAVGMVVDNAIVVLENIYRRLQAGDKPLTAAYRGGKEVWGAILASTLTTVAVFIPVLTIKEEAGQLFRDISLAIIGAVALSLIVSITVIPAACSRWLKPNSARRSTAAAGWKSLFGLAPKLATLTNNYAKMLRWVATGSRAWTLRPAVIIALTGASLLGAWALMPPMDYLPAGNKNLVFGGMSIPPGYSIEYRTQIAERIEAKIKPYADADINDPASMATLDPIVNFFNPSSSYDAVPVRNFFIGAFGGSIFVGATSQDEDVVIPIGTLVTGAINSIPDAFGGAGQASIFGRGAGGGRSINVEISGPELDKVRAAAGMMLGTAMGKFGGGNVNSSPGNFNLQQQEWRFNINETGRELGLTTRDLGVAVRGLVDGAFVGDFKLDGEPIDLVVLPTGGRLDYKEQLATIPVATPAGPVVPLDSVVDLVPTLSPQTIKRIEELPSVTLAITPEEGRAIEEVMAEIEETVIAPARLAGLIDSTMRIRLEGTAAKLDEVKTSLFGHAAAGDTSIALLLIASLLTITGLGLSLRSFLMATRRKDNRLFYAILAWLLLTVTIGGLGFGLAISPHLAGARIVWALAVTYLVMCALFESFIYPFVIMFTVPLAVVGGFAGLRIVHEITMANPVRAPQQLDVLTMLGFVILIGVVVNNAILIVHQALNFMRGDPEHDAPPMAPLDAIAESARTRVRPIFMGTLTSVGGMTPLVLFPGAGSEMYRGLGSVVIGGLLVSTVFTLLLVPLLFGLVLQMADGIKASLTSQATLDAGVAEMAAEPFEAPSVRSGGTPEVPTPTHSG